MLWQPLSLDVSAVNPREINNLEQEKKELVRLVLVATSAFFLGYFSLLIQGWGQGFSAEDMVNSYDTGYNEALRTNPASDRLEVVCAALWFGSQVRE